MVRGGRETYALSKLEHECIELNSLASTLNSDGIAVFSSDEIEHAHMLTFLTHVFGIEYGRATGSVVFGLLFTKKRISVLKKTTDPLRYYHA